MGKPNRSYAEEGLEEINETNGAAEANISSTATGGTDDEFQQVGGLEPVSYFYRTSAPKTKPKHPYKILEKGQTITGVYERNFITGKFKNPTYLIRLTDGTLIGLPGAGSLKRAMDKLSEGSKVKIQYDGMATIKGGEWAGNNAHNFTVFGSKLKA
jgi:hypothetical protein